MTVSGASKMHDNTAIYLVLLTWLAATAGCASSPPGVETGGSDDALTRCRAPRPEACTMHYDPVCGILRSGAEKTYSNGCAACSDHEVSGYRAGSCAA